MVPYTQIRGKCKAVYKLIWSYYADFYRPQRSCGQGNIFTPVCHSFCSQGGVCLSACWDTMPVSRHPPPGPDTTPPRTRHPPGADPPGPDTPPGADTPPWSRPPTPPEQTPAYGLRVAGTQPTGMHSCLKFNYQRTFVQS